MGKVVLSICMVISLVFVTTSCIKETLNECPPQYLVKVVVKDKNYVNVSQFPQIIAESETQPFAHFSGTIYYTLDDVATGKSIQQSGIMTPGANDADYTISLENIPVGQYKLTVWGNLRADVPVGVLHKDGNEYTDIYVATAILDFAPEIRTATLELERAKGQLLILCSNFPEYINRIEKVISPVYQSVDPNLNYTGSTLISKNAPFSSVNKLLAAPTLPGGGAKLNLNFYADAHSSEPVLTIPNVEVAIRRNELSAVSINYNEAIGIWEIWVYVQGKWTMIHSLDIH